MKINPKPTLENFGGKGYQLTQLAKNFLVPDFFVLQFDDANEIKSSDNQKLILETFDKNRFTIVSVRSSATVEDGNKASFAGMFETELNIEKNNLICAIEKVLKSINSSRVKDYCELNKIAIKTVKMNIVIQKMVNSRISGVCLTRDKVGGDMIIEACHGLGEGLVSGLVTPDTYIINRNTFEIINKNIGYQKNMITNKGEVPVPFFLCNCQKMTDDEIKQLAKICLKIEQKYNYKSADVEWAFEHEKIYILQSRAFVGL